MVQIDVADLDVLTLIYTEDRFVLMVGAPAVMSSTGSYEVLSDTHLLHESAEGTSVIQYSLPDASTLILTISSTLNPEGTDVVTAKRMR